MRGLSHVDSPQRSHAPSAAPIPTASESSEHRGDYTGQRRDRCAGAAVRGSADELVDVDRRRGRTAA